MNIGVTVILMLLSASSLAASSTVDDAANAKAASMVWDTKGYILYCPCMGRFGNQMDQFLGMLRWAKTLDRTLILPPIIEYHGYDRRLPRFSQYFKIAPLRKYHRVIELHQFIHLFNSSTISNDSDATVIPSPWPVDERTSLCYPDHGSAATSTAASSSSSSAAVRATCNYRRGQPSTDFWNLYSLYFARSIHFSSSYLDTNRWQRDMSASRLPVLVLGGPLTPFPVVAADRELQQYLKWNHRIADNAETFIEQYLSPPYLAIHLRNGQDWASACKHATGESSYMASPQCLASGQTVTAELCYPDTKLIVSTVKRAVKKYNLQSLFIATDSNDLRDAIQNGMPDLRIAPVVPPLEDLSDVQEVQSATLDLAIMAQANYFIGNCVSSFTAFVKRERDIKKLPTGFFGYKSPKPATDKDDL